MQFKHANSFLCMFIGHPSRIVYYGALICPKPSQDMSNDSRKAPYQYLYLFPLLKHGLCSTYGNNETKYVFHRTQEIFPIQTFAALHVLLNVSK